MQDFGLETCLHLAQRLHEGEVGRDAVSRSVKLLQRQAIHKKYLM